MALLRVSTLDVRREFPVVARILYPFARLAAASGGLLFGFSGTGAGDGGAGCLLPGHRQRAAARDLRHRALLRVSTLVSRGYLAGAGRIEHDTVREAAEGAGVFGVPSFIVDGELFWGREHLADIKDKLTASGRNPLDPKLPIC